MTRAHQERLGMSVGRVFGIGLVCGAVLVACSGARHATPAAKTKADASVDDNNGSHGTSGLGGANGAAGSDAVDGSAGLLPDGGLAAMDAGAGSADSGTRDAGDAGPMMSGGTPPTS